MQTRGLPRDGLCADRSGKRFTMFGFALLTMLGAGCGTQSSLGDLPNSRSAYGSCPKVQTRVCNVGWASRLNDRERYRSCICTAGI